MPFTPAHPAILLPAKLLPRKYISWTALFIGSMVPDMEYFLFMNPGSRMSHSIYGIINFNLPMTFLLAMAWHSFVGPVVLRVLPFFRVEYTRIHHDFADWLTKNWLVFILSALVGICSHLFLDGFCHHRGFIVQRIPYLTEMVHFAGFDIRRCYLVWYVSSAVGMLLMFVFVMEPRNLLKKLKWQQALQGWKFWLQVFVVALVIASVRIAFGLKWNIVRHLVIISIGALFYSVLLVALAEKLRRKKV